jgi:hypothetical protein
MKIFLPVGLCDEKIRGMDAVPNGLIRNISIKGWLIFICAPFLEYFYSKTFFKSENWGEMNASAGSPEDD